MTLPPKTHLCDPRPERIGRVAQSITGRNNADDVTTDEAAIAEALVDLERGEPHAAERLADAVKTRSGDGA